MPPETGRVYKRAPAEASKKPYVSKINLPKQRYWSNSRSDWVDPWNGACNVCTLSGNDQGSASALVVGSFAFNLTMNNFKGK